MTKAVVKNRWIGQWKCSCGAEGDSSSIVYKTMPNGTVSLRCPKCDSRIMVEER